MGPHKIAKILQCPEATKKAHADSKSRSLNGHGSTSHGTDSERPLLPDWVETRTKKGNLFHAILQYCAIKKDGFSSAKQLISKCYELNDWTDEFKTEMLGVDKRLEFIDYSKNRAKNLQFNLEDFESFFQHDFPGDYTKVTWSHEEKITGQFETPIGFWKTRGSIDLYGKINDKIYLIELKSKKDVTSPKEEWKNQLVIYEKMVPNMVKSYVFWPLDTYEISERDHVNFDLKFDEEISCEGCYLCKDHLR